MPAAEAAVTTCEREFLGTYRMVIAERRQLFVANLYAGPGAQYFYLIVYDPKTGALTKAPPRTSSRWMDDERGLSEPLVSRADVFRDGNRQIVLEQRVHNGTMYNAVIYHYFAVGPHLELTRVLARETNVLAPWPADGRYVREITKLAPRRLRLETFQERPGRTKGREAIGYVILQSPHVNAPFRVVKRHAFGPGAHIGLVTCTDEAPTDDTFLREGYTYD